MTARRICGKNLSGGVVECVARPSTGRCYYCDRSVGDTTPRIKRAVLAVIDRLDPVLAELAELAGELSMSQAERLLRQDVPQLLELLARVREIIDASVARQTALAAIDGWADIRDALYPDTDVARQLNVRRRMTPAEHAAEREASSAAEREAWAGIRTTEDPPEAWHVRSDIPDEAPACPTCGKPMHHRATVTSAGQRPQDAGDVCLDCSGLREPVRPCAECGRHPAECGHE